MFLWPYPIHGVGQFRFSDAPRAVRRHFAFRETPRHNSGDSPDHKACRAKALGRVRQSLAHPADKVLSRGTLQKSPGRSFRRRRRSAPPGTASGRVATASRMEVASSLQGLSPTLHLDFRPRPPLRHFCAGLLPQRAFPPSEARTSLPVSAFPCFLKQNGRTYRRCGESLPPRSRPSPVNACLSKENHVGERSRRAPPRGVTKGGKTLLSFRSVSLRFLAANTRNSALPIASLVVRLPFGEKTSPSKPWPLRGQAFCNRLSQRGSPSAPSPTASPRRLRYPEWLDATFPVELFVAWLLSPGRRRAS